MLHDAGCVMSHRAASAGTTQGLWDHSSPLAVDPWQMARLRNHHKSTLTRYEYGQNTLSYVRSDTLAATMDCCTVQAARAGWAPTLSPAMTGD